LSSYDYDYDYDPNKLLFVIARVFVNLFQTNHIDTFKHCLQSSNFQLT